MAVKNNHATVARHRSRSEKENILSILRIADAETFVSAVADPGLIFFMDISGTQHLSRVQDFER